MNITLQIASREHLPLILSALEPFSVRVVERKPKATREETEYKPVFYKKRLGDDKAQAEHYRDAGREVEQDEAGYYEPGEIDGITAAKRIRALMNECAARQRHDGRSPKHFARLDYTKGSGLDHAAEYVRRFCSQFSHVKAAYTINGETVQA